MSEVTAADGSDTLCEGLDRTGDSSGQKDGRDTAQQQAENNETGQLPTSPRDLLVHAL